MCGTEMYNRFKFWVLICRIDFCIFQHMRNYRYYTLETDYKRHELVPNFNLIQFVLC